MDNKKDQLIKPKRKYTKKKSLVKEEGLFVDRSVNLNETVDLIKKQKEEDEVRRVEWLKENFPDIDINYYTELFTKNQDEIIKYVLPEVIKSFSAIDGIDGVNKILHSALGMQDAGIDLGNLIDVQNKLLKIQIIKKLISISSLSIRRKKEIFSRIIAKEFPTESKKITKDDSQKENR